MKNTTRIDWHRAAAFVPADYDYCFSYALPFRFNGVRWVGGINMDAFASLALSGARFAEHGAVGRCTVCGAAFIYGDVWMHRDTQEFIHVGHTCAAKYSMLADRSHFEMMLLQAQKECKAEASRVRNAKARAAMFERHPELEAALSTDHDIVRNIAGKFATYGMLSDAQCALVVRIAHQERERAARKAMRDAEVKVPAPTGRVDFEGVVVAVKLHDSMYGATYKATVKVTTPVGVWLAWMTVPAGVGMPAMDLRGRRVSVRATLTRGNEAHFAFGKRPTMTVLAVGVPEYTEADAERERRAGYVINEGETAEERDERRATGVTP